MSTHRAPPHGRRALATLLATLACSCGLGGRSAHGDVPEQASAAASSPTASTTAVATSIPRPAPADGSSPGWLGRLKNGDEHGAFLAIQALSETARNTPDIRLVTAYLALQVGDFPLVKRSLTGLEQQLPELQTAIESWRTTAMAHVGPHDQAARRLAASPKVVDRVAAARAYVRAGDLKMARKVADAAVKLADKTRRRREEAEARSVRATIAERSKQWAIAAADWGWIVRRRPADTHARAALDGLDRIGGRVSLDHRLAVLSRNVSRDSLPQVLETLEQLAPKHRTKKASLALARAKAIARTRDWARAVKAYDAAAKLRSGHRGEARYHAARATERLGQHEDALKRYAAIIRQHPKSGWSERASFRRASLLMRRGDNKGAAWAFAKYLSRYGKSKHASEARYWRALALLESGRPKRSRAIFSALRKKSRKRREQSRLKQLEGVAAWRSGDKKRAIALWVELCKREPLTWPALMARARLVAAGHPSVPPLIGAAQDTSPTPGPLTVVLPASVAKLDSLGLDEVAEDALRRQEHLLTDAHPGRESEALCQGYGKLRVAKQRYRTANRAVSLKQLMRAPSTAERWTWQCMYPEPFAATVASAAKTFQVPKALLYGVMRQESAFRTHAVSHAGAQGLMQVMPQTARRVAAESKLDGTHPTQPKTNIFLGAFYLGKLLRNFQGIVPIAVAAYNAGPRAVSHWLRPNNPQQLDLWVARIPYKETRDYAARVMTNFARYQWMNGGLSAVDPPTLAMPKTFDIGKDAY
ncbi:MAG: transglycosylase SLT domain-containing protein [Polyangiaceae bacterium]